MVERKTGWQQDGLNASDELEKYKLMANTSYEGIVLSVDGIILDFNERFQDFVGYSRDELIGMPILKIIAPESVDDVNKSIKENSKEPYNFVWVTKNGQKRHIEARISYADLGGKKVRAATLRDITERQKFEEALKKSEEKFSTAFHTSPDSININRLSDGLYLEINQGFTDIMGYSSEDVIGKTSLELDIWCDPADRQKLVEGLRKNGEVKNLEALFKKKNGISVYGLMSARIIIVNDEKCILSVTRDIDQRKAAQQQIENLNQELLLAYDETLTGWSRALNLRDANTDVHSRRVVDLTVEIARAVGIPENDLIHVRRGAILHDIGKMAIPDRILHKPGKLSDDEWVIMRQHPTYAYEMLSRIPFLCPALDIPYCHHEKWDGSGYPRGLKGEEIPLAARIFAFVDVFDALTSDRVYRPAWPVEKAMQYIHDNSGTHFDPSIIKLFLKMVVD